MFAKIGQIVSPFPSTSDIIRFMKETLNNSEAERRPPLIIRNALVAHGVAYIVDKSIGDGCTPDGHKLLRKLIVKICKGDKISISRDIANVYHGAELSIEVEGQENIPPAGPTIFIANHTCGGPMNSIGQFFQMAKEAYGARFNVQDEKVREPFIIMQRGLAKGKIIQYFSGILYEIVGQSLNCEVVEIPRYNNDKEIINGQKLKSNVIERITNGGAALWAPQGTHRDADDLFFPEKKGNGFLQKVYNEDTDVQLVPVRSIPDTQGNVKIIFGKAVELYYIVENGGINYFTQKHLVPLGQVKTL